MTSIGQLVDSTPLLDDPTALRARFAQDGFVFLRGLVGSGAVAQVRGDILRVLDEAGWLVAGSSPEDARPGPTIHREGDQTWFEVYTRVQRLYSFHALAHRDELLAPIRALTEGDDILVHPRKIARITYPSSQHPTPPHQDFPLIQGSADTYTLWMSLAHCPVELGALRLLPGSHLQGVRSAVPRMGVGGVGVEVEPEDPRFQAAEYDPGDAVVFHSFTVHHAPPNEGDRIRLSVDYRYQSVHDPVLDMSLHPHRFPLVPDNEVIGAGWPSLDPVRAPEGLTVTQLADPMGDLGRPSSRYPVWVGS